MQAQPSFDPFFGGGMHTNTYVGAAPRPMFPGNAPQFGFGGPVQYGAAPAPLRVRPGDPRIGGVLCGRCRGSGLVRDFLDEETCHVCRGLGRIIHT